MANKSKFTFNKIFVIESLRKVDKKTGYFLHHDTIFYKLLEQRENKSIISEYAEIFSKNDLIQFFNDVRNEINEKGVLPFFHIETHGNSSGLELSNGEIITWPDLASELIQINVACKNNLYITIASCEGSFLALTNTKLDRAAFFGMLGFDNELKPQEITELFSNFYSTLLTDFDFDKSLETTKKISDKKNLSLREWTSDWFFAEAFLGYMVEIEPVVPVKDRAKSAIKNNQMYKNLSRPEKRRLQKEFIKKFYRVDRRTIFDKFQNQFLMFDLHPENKKRQSFSYDDVNKNLEIIDSKKNNDRGKQRKNIKSLEQS